MIRTAGSDRRTRRMAALALVALVAAVGLPSRAARADMIQLKDGRFVEGVTARVDGDALVLKYVNGEVRVPLASVADYSLDSGEVSEPATAEEREKRAQGLVRFEGKWVRAEARKRELDRRREEKRKALEEYRKHRDWKDRYQFKSKHFDFESTLPPHINADFAAMMDTYFAEFSKVWKTQVPKDWGRLKVCFHGDLDAFERTAGAGGGVLAYYRFAPPRELNFYYDRRDPDGSLATMFHEANHYLTDLMDDKFQYPHWVNEAMAEYYGTALWDPDRKTLTTGGVQPGRLVEVLDDIERGKRFALKDLIGDDSQAYAHYYWGWSFVHFMMETEKYSKRFRTFFNDLARARDVKRVPGSWGFTEVTGEECRRVFMHRMGLRDTDLDGLQTEWYAYIDALPREGVKGHEEAGRRAFANGKTKFQARELLKSAIDRGSVNTQTYVLYARCLAMYDGLAEAVTVMEKACTLDPVDADLRAYHALLLKRAGNETEGARIWALAREMAPDEDFLSIQIQIAMMERMKAKGGE